MYVASIYTHSIFFTYDHAIVCIINYSVCVCNASICVCCFTGVIIVIVANSDVGDIMTINICIAIATTQL